MSESESFIIWWNNTFPLDREYRKKYNIPFNSPQHRAINQIDVYLEWLENKMIDDRFNEMKKEIEKEKLYKKGIWLSEQEDDEMSDELFDNIKI